MHWTILCWMIWSSQHNIIILHPVNPCRQTCWNWKKCVVVLFNHSFETLLLMTISVFVFELELLFQSTTTTHLFFSIVATAVMLLAYWFDWYFCLHFERNIGLETSLLQPDHENCCTHFPFGFVFGYAIVLQLVDVQKEIRCMANDASNSFSDSDSSTGVGVDANLDSVVGGLCLKPWWLFVDVDSNKHQCGWLHSCCCQYLQARCLWENWFLPSWILSCCFVCIFCEVDGKAQEHKTLLHACMCTIQRRRITTPHQQRNANTFLSQSKFLSHSVHWYEINQWLFTSMISCWWKSSDQHSFAHAIDVTYYFVRLLSKEWCPCQWYFVGWSIPIVVPAYSNMLVIIWCADVIDNWNKNHKHIYNARSTCYYAIERTFTPSQIITCAVYVLCCAHKWKLPIPNVSSNQTSLLFVH